MRTLVLGGARSGKSAHAEGLLGAGPATYVATGRRDPADAEWSARIAAHVARRPATWRTVESDPVDVLRAAAAGDPPILVDDIGTWLTGVLDDTGGWTGPPTAARRAGAALADATGSCRTDLVLVSAEVGLGVVPQTRSGRLFRDELGALNAALADRCTDVVLLVAGLPLRLKPGR
ncbi:MAG TPA: bifunctional adenosylcobinamide kinase/adenosylcobinamide-phosphate guanylyltransferase [Actinophytocola sp.]|uniref:bifunctional adenosylcobinamide kinase/adenosylcobinamide-phosphate guanylyltransferase n=1 Tax=Actinophytocola sp. TaxID=1872138 RepID=UPI002DBF1A89|nr:bifunctional adenosylcobinamide kinase/adenosylcobinamide-phosphate guanylyltransferase [Actinophytocola sp.]HEU5473954.1 bifunctional adenosylcobinamide kinase/adenosylcobinamide-phosphate guanylyltransferase [Actinophytocola sp.]